MRSTRGAAALQLPRRDPERRAPHPCVRIPDSTAAAQALRESFRHGIARHLGIARVREHRSPEPRPLLGVERAEIGRQTRARSRSWVASLHPARARSGAQRVPLARTGRAAPAGRPPARPASPRPPAAAARRCPRWGHGSRRRSSRAPGRRSARRRSRRRSTRWSPGRRPAVPGPPGRSPDRVCGGRSRTRRPRRRTARRTATPARSPGVSGAHIEMSPKGIPRARSADTVSSAPGRGTNHRRYISSRGASAAARRWFEGCVAPIDVTIARTFSSIPPG